MKSSHRPSLALAALVLFFTLGSGTASAGIVDSLVSQLGVTNEQATGGAGAIFDYGKRNLEPEDFATVADGIPDMDDLLSAAPDLGESDSALGKLGGIMGDKGGSLGAMASLAGSFESLGLDAEMAQKFLPVVLDYVESTGGEQAMGLLKGLF